MSLAPRIYENKHCLVYCGPERCNCRRNQHLDIFRTIDKKIADATVVPVEFLGGESVQKIDEPEEVTDVWNRCTGIDTIHWEETITEFVKVVEQTHNYDNAMSVVDELTKSK